MKKIEDALKMLSETQWNYWLSFIFDAVIAITLAVVAFNSGATLLSGLGFFFLGILFFTLIEYLVHAKLFHGSIKPFVKAHAKHHKDPFGFDAMPFFFAMFIIAPFYGLAYFAFGFEHSTIFTSGIFIGYISYGMMHHAMHRVKSKNVYFSYMVAFHDLHHVTPKMNHGVTVPFWDMVFGTYLSIKK